MKIQVHIDREARTDLECSKPSPSTQELRLLKDGAPSGAALFLTLFFSLVCYRFPLQQIKWQGRLDESLQPFGIRTDSKNQDKHK